MNVVVAAVPELSVGEPPPLARWPKTFQFDCGTVLLTGTVLTTGVSVGRHVVVMPKVTLTHDDEVKDFATLCAGVALGGNVVVGQHTHLGTSSSVRGHTTVEARSVLGIDAAPVTDLPAGQTWTGVPARPRQTTATTTSIGSSS